MQRRWMLTDADKQIWIFQIVNEREDPNPKRIFRANDKVETNECMQQNKTTYRYGRINRHTT